MWWKKMSLAVMGLILVVLFCFLPDLLFRLRCVIKALPVLNNLVCKSIKDTDYIELMLVPLLNCIAITVSVLAFHTAKTTEETQLLQQKAKVIKASSNMLTIIETNTVVVYNIQRNTSNINELLVDSYAIEYAACLYGASEITLKEFNFFKEFARRISYIKTNYSDQEVQKFNDKYLKSNSMQYAKELQELVEHLNTIIGGENNNEET